MAATLGVMYAIYSQPDRSAGGYGSDWIAAAAEFDTDTGLPVVCYTFPLAH